MHTLDGKGTESKQTPNSGISDTHWFHQDVDLEVVSGAWI